jgi:diguanylate cyclase (GGDEF)-like protein
LESGADDFIAKPFRTPELYARLRSGQRVLSLQRELLAERTRIEDLATHDFLTGLWNRRAIFEKLCRELSLSQRELRPLGVILMDIDHFKQINDSFGHAQGDQVLLETAKRLAEGVRPYDSVGRYGGEEFLLFVSNCDLWKTLSIAERLRLAVGAAPMEVSGGFIRVTGSFGVCVTDPSQRAGAQSVIETADRALYRAKELGRNRVECDREITSVPAMRHILQ